MTAITPPELAWLAATAVLCALLFMPYVLARIGRLGLFAAMRNPQPDQDPEHGWSWRAARAHSNNVDNLVTFAPLVLVVVHLELTTPMTATACAIYFFARVAHYLIYVAGIPYLRTIAFFIGTCAQIALALRIFGLA